MKEYHKALLPFLLMYGQVAELSKKELSEKGKKINNIYNTKITIQKPVRGNLFKFPDGFECRALNQKNANRKHNRFLKSIK